MAAFGTYSNGGLGFGLAFTLEDGFSNVASQIQSKMAQFDVGVQRLADRVNSAMGRVQSGIALIATGVALAAPLGYGVKIAGEFEQARLGLETFLGSAQQATVVFENIKQDAARTPFGIEPLLNVNQSLISVGLSADRARRDTLGLANAVAASGRGNAELARMAWNLQDIYNKGAANAVDLKQFGTAGINIYRVISDATGLSIEKVKELTVSYDLLTYSLNKAAEQGGLYGGAMERLAQSINGKLEQISDKFKYMAASLGEAIMPIVHKVFDFLIVGLDRLTAFMDTDIGKMIAQVVALSVAFVSLAVIGAGLSIVFIALSQAVLPLLGTILLYTWPIVALGVAFIGLNTAVNMFDKSVKEAQVPAQGFEGWLERIGGRIRVIQQMWSNVDLTKNVTYVDSDVYRQMKASGMEQFMSDASTWIIRLKIAWVEFKADVMIVWETVGQIWANMSTVFNELNSWITKVNTSLGIGETSLDTWKNIGKVLAGIFTVMVSPLIIMGTIMYAAYNTFKLIVSVVEALINRIVEFGSKIKQYMITPISELKGIVKTDFSFLGNDEETVDTPTRPKKIEDWLKSPSSNAPSIGRNATISATPNRPNAESGSIEGMMSQLKEMFTKQSGSPTEVVANFFMDGKKMATVVAKHMNIDQAREAQ